MPQPRTIGPTGAMWSYQLQPPDSPERARAFVVDILECRAARKSHRVDDGLLTKVALRR